MTLLGVAISKVVGYGDKPQKPKKPKPSASSGKISIESRPTSGCTLSLSLSEMQAHSAITASLKTPDGNETDIPKEIATAPANRAKSESADNDNKNSMLFSALREVEAFAEGPLIPGGQESAMIWSAIKAQNIKPPSASIIIGGCGDSLSSSCIAAGLALEIARKNTGRVAIVDTNTHSPHLASILEYDGKPGMVDVLTGKLNIEEALCHSKADNLHALIMNPSDAEMLELDGSIVTERMARAIGTLVAACDYVIIDAGIIDDEQPVRSVFGRSSGTVLALRHGVTRLAVRKTRSRIEGAGGNVLGAIVVQTISNSAWAKSRR